MTTALSPRHTAARMIHREGVDRAISAALDYRFNLYDRGTFGYKFWTDVLEVLLNYKKRKQRESITEKNKGN